MLQAIIKTEEKKPSQCLLEGKGNWEAWVGGQGGVLEAKREN